MSPQNLSTFVHVSPDKISLFMSLGQEGREGGNDTSSLESENSLTNITLDRIGFFP